ncbi:MAG: ABC transporter substrate-binding protein [Planctomycetota bacterium]
MGTTVGRGRWHLLLFGLLGLLPAAACDPAPRPIRIACPLAPSHVQGAMLAVDEINGAGGIHGRPLELVGDESLSGEPIAVANRIGAGGFGFVVGHLGSHDSMVAGKIYEALQILMLTPNATHPKARGGAFSFAMCKDDVDEAAFLAQQAIGRFHAERVVLLYENLDYGRDLARCLEDELIGRNVRPVRILNHASAGDLTPIIEAACRESPDLIFCASQMGHAVAVQQYVAKHNLRTRVLGGDALDQQSDLKGFPDAKGLLMVRLFSASSAAALARFAAAYRSKYGEEPESHSALAYDAVIAGATALKSGAETAGDLVRALLQFGRDRQAPTGATGPICFDATRKRTGLEFELCEFDGHDIVPLKEQP